MGTEPTLPLPGSGGPGQFPPPADPWSTPDAYPPTPLPDPTSDPGPAYPPSPTSGAPGSHPPPNSGTSGPYPPPTSGAPATYSPPSGPTSGQGAGDGVVVAQIGEIRVTSSAVFTPAGTLPLAGSTWQVNDFWQMEQRTPRWAVILAIVGFCVVTFFSLLLLLVKETIHRGTVQVTVTSGAHQYVARIPVTEQAQVQYVHQQVNYVRALAAL
jgi:hypothetical protein